MADVLKVLGQVSPAATTVTTLYIVPTLAVTTTSSLVICNRSASTPTFRVSVHVDGDDAGTPTAKQYIYYDKATVANDTLVAVLGMTLNEGDVIQVYASSTDISFTLFGVETS
jgi:hypothetical protein